jgi:hypothetical protein
MRAVGTFLAGEIVAGNRRGHCAVAAGSTPPTRARYTHIMPRRVPSRRLGRHSQRSFTASGTIFASRRPRRRTYAITRKIFGDERQVSERQKVTSCGTAEFWRLYHELPPKMREAARKAFQKFSENPSHPGLQLERLKFDDRAWSVRVTRNYRAVARRYGEDWLWFWIGSHEEFDRRFPK